MMFQTFAVTYALIKISVEAGHPGFGIYFPNQIKRSAIKQAKESNLGWGKWQIAMFIISTARLLAKKGKLIDKKHSHVKNAYCVVPGSSICSCTPAFRA
jgi:hypothetical protein